MDGTTQKKPEGLRMVLGILTLDPEPTPQPNSFPDPNLENQVGKPSSSEAEVKPVILWYPELFWLPLILLVLYLLLVRRRPHDFRS